MEAAVPTGVPLDDRVPQVRRGPTRERRPALADRRERVGVAVADHREAELVRELDRLAVPRAAESRRIERLERVGAVTRIGLAGQPAQRTALGAERVGHERMGRDRDAALVVDAGNRLAQGPEGFDRMVDEERQQVPAAGRHFLADDHLEPQAVVLRDCPRGDRGIDPFVVRDRDHVERRGALHVVEDLEHARGPVGREGVDVQVGAAEPVGHAGGALIGGASGPRLEVGPDREEDAPPLVRRGRDEALECARLRVKDGEHAVAAGPLGRERKTDQLAHVSGAAIATNRADEDGRSGLDSQQRSSDRERCGGAEQLDGHAAAREVAIADDADRFAPLQRREQSPAAPRAARRSEGRRPRASGPPTPGARRPRAFPSARWSLHPSERPRIRRAPPRRCGARRG